MAKREKVIHASGSAFHALGLEQEPQQAGNLADAIRARIEPLGGVEISLPQRGPMDDPPQFAWPA